MAALAVAGCGAPHQRAAGDELSGATRARPPGGRLRPPPVAQHDLTAYGLHPSDRRDPAACRPGAGTPFTPMPDTLQ